MQGEILIALAVSNLIATVLAVVVIAKWLNRIFFEIVDRRVGEQIGTKYPDVEEDLMTSPYRDEDGLYSFETALKNQKAEELEKAGKKMTEDFENG